MIQVEGLWKSYGRQALFENVGFKINKRERVGVVGRNGHGKTTLFRIIAGLEQPDSGNISIPRNYHIGYVVQEPRFTERTVRRETAQGLPPSEADCLWKVEKVLAGLGFSPADMDRPPEEFSGGFQVRLNLAKVLLADHDLLLLDEPNNYLDITSIRWLSNYLSRWPGELMLITHDRSFMDSVVTHILGIHRRRVRKIAGDTGKYYDQIAQDEETYEKTRLNDERKAKEMDLFISRFRAKARLANLVQSRVKTLARMEKKEKLEAIQDLDFQFSHKPFHGKYVMNIRDLTFGYNKDNPLIRDLGIGIGSRDRVCVVGKNGKGKTTLLKLMAGLLQPDHGEVSYPQAAAIGYFEQTHIVGLNESNTVIEEVASMDPERDPRRARQICGGMLFEGENALKKINILSGGEKSRVVLGKLIATPLNLLLLDEPTNHLDLESSDALLAALDDFPGAVVMVTHNEMFLNALAERLIVFQNDQVTVYEGDYQRFLEKIGWQDEGDRIQVRAEKSAACGEKEKVSPKELRRIRSEIVNERSRVLKPVEKRISEIEHTIESLEKDLDRINRELLEASESRKGMEIVDLSKSMHRTRVRIDGLFAELEGLLTEQEKARAEFEQKLSSLDDE